MLKIFEKSAQSKDSVAVIHDDKVYSYEQLKTSSDQMAFFLLQGHDDLKEERIAFMVKPGFDYIKTLWAIWKAGGVAVPLSPAYPADALEYVINDLSTKRVFINLEFIEKFQKGNLNHIELFALEHDPSIDIGFLPDLKPDRRALILYTSGTTSLPKGVVTTHANIQAQIESLVKAWEWNETDHILCVLPLHHIHGIINVIGCALYSGAKVEFLTPFDPVRIFEIFTKAQVNLFMAVPTIYYKLIAYLETVSPEKRKELKQIMAKFRLMVSGSAALPVSTMEKWEKLSNHRLLERYGMTEIGMAISNPYRGERLAGHIGQPLPGVQIRLVDDEGEVVGKNTPGEIQIKGANVFKEYWNKSEATLETFTKDGWFKSGDVAIFENGSYKIMGRSSVDIIKSGGYKISALEIEEILRTYSGINDCAVVGIADDEWGELIVAALVVNSEIDQVELTKWLKTKMPAYRLPRKFLLLQELPRNAMGKVIKNEVKGMF